MASKARKRLSAARPYTSVGRSAVSLVVCPSVGQAVQFRQSAIGQKARVHWGSFSLPSFRIPFPPFLVFLLLLFLPHLRPVLSLVLFPSPLEAFFHREEWQKGER